MDFVTILMRFLHIASAVTLVGGAVGLAFVPQEADLQGWRRLAFAAIALLLGTGLWNFLHKTDLPPTYHAVFGIKILLALHVFAVSIIATKPNNPRRVRQFTGVAISGLGIVLLSAVLRSLTLR